MVVDGDGDPDLLDGFDITVNFQRQMTQRAPIRPGDALRLEFVAFGTGVVTALPVLTLQRLPRGLPALGGTWFLDPGASALLGAIASSAGQSGTLSIAIPNTPAIVGLGAQLQGLVVEANGRLALTNHIATVVE